MSSIYDLVFARLDPEHAHDFVHRSLTQASRWDLARNLVRLVSRVPAPDPRLSLDRFGVRFAHPLGAAAGVDKDGAAVPALWAMGFCAVEVGTVTPLPQPGNPPPRLWRFADQRAVVNAMGFPSPGRERVRQILAAHPTRAYGQVLGLNVGKNRDTPLDRAVVDYQVCIESFVEYADYIALNVSSPNTVGLRLLQHAETLGVLLRACRQVARSTPVLVKIAPDLDDAELEATAGAALDAGAAGIIATNTTTAREGLPDSARVLPGGASGPPLRARSQAIVRRLHQLVGKRVPIIGVGGIASGADALQHIAAGASLVQLYTALIYEGPSLPGQILRALSADADRRGWRSIDEIVGVSLN